MSDTPSAIIGWPAGELELIGGQPRMRSPAAAGRRGSRSDESRGARAKSLILGHPAVWNAGPMNVQRSFRKRMHEGALGDGRERLRPGWNRAAIHGRVAARNKELERFNPR